MASIALKTFKGGNVTPQDDAIIYQTALPGAGIFRGCEVSFARSNVLHISSGFGMIKGRFFEMYENEIPVQMADTGMTLNGRIYIHMDLSNADEPVQILTETAATLSNLAADANVNYNNTTYDLELAQFKVTSSEIKDLTNVYKTITGGGSGGGGAVGLERETAYAVGDTISCSSAPGWCTLYCSQAGLTATAEPKGYAQITKVGDTVLDGTCIFVARNTLAELTQAQTDLTSLSTKHDKELASLEKKHSADVSALEKKISDTADEVAKQMSSTGNLVQKIMSITDYNKLSSYDSNTMYYCYDNADTQEIKAIYLGQHVIYATGVSVTYQVDTSNAINQTAALTNDAVAMAPAVSKAGYTFVGWKSDTNADSEILKEYKISSSNAVKLYAVFKKTIKIDMDCQDADVPKGAEEPSFEVLLYYNNGNTMSDEVEMPECPYTMGDLLFCGWATSTSADQTHMPGVKYRFVESTTLYPRFIESVHNFDDPYTGYTYFKIEASGIYEFECWGAEGGTASGTVDGTSYEAKGGKGGHVRVYKKLKKGTGIYIYNGFHPNGISGSYNLGGNGSTYSTSKHIGAAGGGATYVTDSTFSLSSMGGSSSYQSSYYKDNKGRIFLIAGGGGGGGISATDYTYANNPTLSYTKGAHTGGYAGGEKGQDGSSGVPGGKQVSTSTTEYYNWGYCQTPSGNCTYSGGGSGWYAGMYGTYGNSGAGGSSYVGNNPTFVYNGVRYKTLNEANVNEGHGKTIMRFILPCEVE